MITFFKFLCSIVAFSRQSSNFLPFEEKVFFNCFLIHHILDMKKFFQKLKADYKFNKAGPGTRLSDDTRREPAQRTEQAGPSSTGQPSAASIRARNDAAEAALARLQKKQVC